MIELYHSKLEREGSLTVTKGRKEKVYTYGVEVSFFFQE